MQSNTNGNKTKRQQTVPQKVQKSKKKRLIPHKKNSPNKIIIEDEKL